MLTTTRWSLAKGVNEGTKNNERQRCLKEFISFCFSWCAAPRLFEILRAVLPRMICL